MMKNWLQSPIQERKKIHEFIVRVEMCGCPDKTVLARSWSEADEIAGHCKHGNRYSTQNFPK